MLLSLRSLAPMDRVAFNTGAYYSPHGQRIGIWLRDVPQLHIQLCCLVDFDRGITGHFPVRLTSSLHSVEDLARHAKYMYDMGQYELGCPQPLDAAIRSEVQAVLNAGYDAFARTPGTQELFGRFDRQSRPPSQGRACVALAPEAFPPHHFDPDCPPCAGSSTSKDTNMFINELDAFCIVLPPDLCPFTGPDHLRFLAISGTEAPPFASERIQYRPVGTGLPMEPPSALIRRICSERAIDTVGGVLRVDGFEITPEAYLKRWRTRLARPIALEHLALSKQLQAVAVFEWRHTAAIGDRKATWRNPPYASFRELLAAHGFTETAESMLMDVGVSGLEIDLSEAHGARDAWWADDWLSALNQGDTVLTRRIEIRHLPAPAASHTRSYNLRVAQALATL